MLPNVTMTEPNVVYTPNDGWSPGYPIIIWPEEGESPESFVERISECLIMDKYGVIDSYMLLHNDVYLRLLRMRKDILQYMANLPVIVGLIHNYRHVYTAPYHGGWVRKIVRITHQLPKVCCVSSIIEYGSLVEQNRLLSSSLLRVSDAGTYSLNMLWRKIQHQPHQWSCDILRNLFAQGLQKHRALNSEIPNGLIFETVDNISDIALLRTIHKYRFSDDDLDMLIARMISITDLSPRDHAAISRMFYLTTSTALFDTMCPISACTTWLATRRITNLIAVPEWMRRNLFDRVSKDGLLRSMRDISDEWLCIIDTYIQVVIRPAMNKRSLICELTRRDGKRLLKILQN